MEGRDGTIRLPKKASKVRNKTPAAVQVTAEQLLREAKERDLEIVAPPPKQKITDPEELKEYQLRRRKEFEDNLRKNRSVISNWIKYSKWEEKQNEIQRARSIFERALDVDHRSIPLWLQYAEMEMRNRQVNHARNIWDRAIGILPRANQFWYKYTYMEEVLGNVPGTRQVFERWLEWEPEEQAWLTYIKFELRYKEIDRARLVYQRFVNCHPDVKNWIRYAKFEENVAHNVEAARQVYERAVTYFGDDEPHEKLLLSFARFEENQKEHERARVVYKYALAQLPKDRTDDIFKSYTIHEKKFGERLDIENVIVCKRKYQYEERIKQNSYDYDAWFDLLRLLESEADTEVVRDTYERAIANVPPQQEKRYWRRYIYLWINYALYEELGTKDLERTEEVYKACLEVIPHKAFTFSKLWLLYAKFQIRQKNLGQARKIMGKALGMCPKDKTFREYINLELALREFDRCRILYEKWLLFSPENCSTWIKFAEMEDLLGDTDRARHIFKLAIERPRLDMPELLWKAYIDFEVTDCQFDNARRLFEALLRKTQHVKVWLAFARFELENGEAPGQVASSREVYQRAHNSLAKHCLDSEERIMLLNAWKAFEEEHGDEDSLKAVEEKMPKRVKRRRPVQAEDGTSAGWEEFYDYIFPEDEASQTNVKLLEMAKKWKQKQHNLQSTSKTHLEETARNPSSSQNTNSDDDSDSESENEGGENTQSEENRREDKNQPGKRREEDSESEKRREGDTDTDIDDSSSSDDDSSDKE